MPRGRTDEQGPMLGDKAQTAPLAGLLKRAILRKAGGVAEGTGEDPRRRQAGQGAAARSELGVVCGYQRASWLTMAGSARWRPEGPPTWVPGERHAAVPTPGAPLTERTRCPFAGLWPAKLDRPSLSP